MRIVLFATILGSGLAACAPPKATEPADTGDGRGEATTDDACSEVTWFADIDADGFGDEAASVRACDPPSATHIPLGGDCDDGAPGVHPDAEERCDGVDNDCDGTIDGDSATDAPTWSVDRDGDGYGDGSTTATACTAPSGYVDDATDCDDGTPAVHPGSVEVCNGVDDDCDGLVDDADSSLDLSTRETSYADSDSDGFGDPGRATEACAAPSDHVQDATDCDDTDPAVHPEAAEVCNGVDDDCDSLTDDADSSLDLTTRSTYYADSDADAYGDAARSTVACSAPSGYVSDATDCDDADSAVSPGATEVCSGVDDDCDGLTDDADSSLDLTTQSTFYADSDADAYGDATRTAAACSAPSGYVSDASDCDDTDAAVSPSALEVCDGIDNDCDGDTDDADSSLDTSTASTFHADTDRDGFGDPSSSVERCVVPSGYTSDGTDCDDTRSAVYPGAAETWYDGVDGDCDGGSDDDADGDSFDSDAHGGTDCDDTSSAVHPLAPEVWYDGVDSDCAGDSDYDADADGYTSDAHGGTDCDDTLDSVHPASPEVCLDGVDNDCDGSRSCDGDLSMADAILEGGAIEVYAGAGATAVPDLDGDGLAELVVGYTDPGSVSSKYVGVFAGPYSGSLSTADASATLTAGSSSSLFGTVFGGVGDLDGDGYGELVVTNPGTSASAGELYLFEGPVSGAFSSSDAVGHITGEASGGAGGFGGGTAGQAVVAAGDVTADGLLDFLVAAPYAPTTSDGRSGAAYLFSGMVTGSVSIATAHAKLEAYDNAQAAGFAVGGAGDFDGDGIADVAVGSPSAGAGGGGSPTGKVYVWLGPVSAGTLPLDSAHVQLGGESAYDQAGASVCGLGDFDGDGYDDLAAGAPDDDDGGTDAGAVYIVLGPQTGTGSLSSASAKLIGETAGDEAGSAISSAGGYARDGTPDLLVGVAGVDSGRGAAYLVVGPLSGAVDLSEAEVRWLGESGGDSAGDSVSGGFDLDGDGLDDVLVGAPRRSGSASNEGAAYVLLGGAL